MTWRIEAAREYTRRCPQHPRVPAIVLESIEGADCYQCSACGRSWVAARLDVDLRALRPLLGALWREQVAAPQELWRRLQTEFAFPCDPPSPGPGDKAGPDGEGRR